MIRHKLSRLAAVLVAVLALTTGCIFFRQAPTNETPKYTLNIVASGGIPVTLSIDHNPLDIEGASAPVEISISESAKVAWGFWPFNVKLHYIGPDGQLTNPLISILAQEDPANGGLAHGTETHDMPVGRYQLYGSGGTIQPVILVVS